MTRPRILFVDDEEAVLEGLEDMFHRDRKRWDLVFATSGEQALALLAGARFDLVVSDMRMPKMDGAELLARVKAQFPRVTRFVLSGHAERHAVLRVVPVAHQLLSKPCDPKLLRAAIESTLNLQRLLDHETIRAVVGRADQLPSVPHVLADLTRLAADPNRSAAELAAVIETDPSITAKVLQLANSSYFGARRPIASLAQAITLLGVDLLKGMALAENIFGAYTGAPIPGFSIERMRARCVLSARLARQLCGASARGDDAFTAALLHEVGQIVLALSMPAELAEMIADARARGCGVEVVERERLGVCHAELGAHLLATWGLPQVIVEAVAFHHSPDQVPAGARDVLVAVHVADALIDERPFGAADRLDLALLEAAGVTAELPRWRALADQLTQGVAL